MTRYQIDEKIQLEVNIPQLLPVHMPQSGLRQVLLNLILNAAEAIEDRVGLICISAKFNQQSLQIDVTDNGPGFSQDMLDYGIRPFRTSRSRGTGLGLAMVQRFVKNIGGIIKLGNQTPNGACVSVMIPKDCLAEGQL